MDDNSMGAPKPNVTEATPTGTPASEPVKVTRDTPVEAPVKDAPVADEQTRFEMPFSTDGVNVIDKMGRVICTMGGVHMTMEYRMRDAEWLVGKMNA